MAAAMARLWAPAGSLHWSPRPLRLAEGRRSMSPLRGVGHCAVTGATCSSNHTTTQHDRSCIPVLRQVSSRRSFLPPYTPLPPPPAPTATQGPSTWIADPPVHAAWCPGEGCVDRAAVHRGTLPAPPGLLLSLPLSLSHGHGTCIDRQEGRIVRGHVACVMARRGMGEGGGVGSGGPVKA